MNGCNYSISQAHLQRLKNYRNSINYGDVYAQLRRSISGETLGENRERTFDARGGPALHFARITCEIGTWMTGSKPNLNQNMQNYLVGRLSKQSRPHSGMPMRMSYCLACAFLLLAPFLLPHR